MSISVNIKWTKGNIKEILDELDAGTSVRDIAKKYKQSVYGISHRIKYAAYDMHKNCIDIQTIINTTKMTEQEVREAIKTIADRESKITPKQIIANQIKIIKTLDSILKLLNANANANDDEWITV